MNFNSNYIFVLNWNVYTNELSLGLCSNLGVPCFTLFLYFVNSDNSFIRCEDSSFSSAAALPGPLLLKEGAGGGEGSSLKE